MPENKVAPKFPEICSLYGSRKVVMSKAHQRVRDKEAAGKPVSNAMFGKFIKEEWKNALERQKKECKYEE